MMRKFSLANIGTAITNKLGRTGLKLKKASPDILVVAGIAGVIGATVMACRNTRKLDAILEEHETKLEEIKSVKEVEESKTEAVECPSDAPEASYSASITRQYISTAVQVGRLYGPCVALYGVSIAAILKSHNILKGRNVALAAAYEALDNTFKRYRGNVIDRYGEEADLDCRHGRTREDVVEWQVDPETGEEYTETNERVLVDVPLDGSEYGRWFDRVDSTEFDPHSPIYNMTYVKGVQAQLEYLLQGRGHVFLNEAYDALGYPRTPAGAVVGWVKGNGDDHVDFGISETVWVRDSRVGQPDITEVDVNDYASQRGGFWLDFNVDGVIYDKI